MQKNPAGFLTAFTVTSGSLLIEQRILTVFNQAGKVNIVKNDIVIFSFYFIFNRIITVFYTQIGRKILYFYRSITDESSAHLFCQI
jgi:hypothetical protein